MDRITEILATMSEGTTYSVASFFDLSPVPVVAPFDPQHQILAMLPDYEPYRPAFVQGVTELRPADNSPTEVDRETQRQGAFPASKASVAQAVKLATMASLEAIQRFENRIAAVKAQLIVNAMNANTLEAQALALEPWQQSVSETSTIAEIALSLHVPESTATIITHHAVDLPRYPQTQTAINAGTISWRHVGIILNECQTLNTTPGITVTQTAAFEQKLLHHAPGTTAAAFTAKARRLREGHHPKTLITRSREAIAKRALTLEPGKDGMSWIGLHLPATAAQGIWVHCTRLARQHQQQQLLDQKQDQDQRIPDAVQRTLTQLRADAAAAILLGQAPSFITIPSQIGHPERPQMAGEAAAPFDNKEIGETSVSKADFAQTGQNDQAPWEVIDDRSESGKALTTAELADGLSGGLVDGVEEDPLDDYLACLEFTRRGLPVTDPPQPAAQVVVTVPVLSLLGTIDQPAELAGYGPISPETGRKILARANSFLRVLTDPISGKALDLPPDRYRLRANERLLLHIIGQSCAWPNCTAPAILAEADHIDSYSTGGNTTLENLQPLCKRHHTIKHFKDDKTRSGLPRNINEPHRNDIKIPGWTPRKTDQGGVGWLTPTGTYHPPQSPITSPAKLPAWLAQGLSAGIPRPTPGTKKEQKGIPRPPGQ